MNLLKKFSDSLNNLNVKIKNTILNGEEINKSNISNKLNNKTIIIDENGIKIDKRDIKYNNKLQDFFKKIIDIYLVEFDSKDLIEANQSIERENSDNVNVNGYVQKKLIPIIDDKPLVLVQNPTQEEMTSEDFITYEVLEEKSKKDELIEINIGNVKDINSINVNNIYKLFVFVSIHDTSEDKILNDEKNNLMIHFCKKVNSMDKYEKNELKNKIINIELKLSKNKKYASGEVNVENINNLILTDIEKYEENCKNNFTNNVVDSKGGKRAKKTSKKSKKTSKKTKKSKKTQRKR